MESPLISFDEAKLQKSIKAIQNWYFSFIPLIIASIIFVFCFIFESNLPLYLAMAFFFVLFIYFYIKTSKQISHKDGYTFIQAMSFYQQASKENITENSSALYQLAKQQDYGETLTENQVLVLYETGKLLTNHMKKK